MKRKRAKIDVSDGSKPAPPPLPPPAQAAGTADTVVRTGREQTALASVLTLDRARAMYRVRTWLAQGKGEDVLAFAAKLSAGDPAAAHALLSGFDSLSVLHAPTAAAPSDPFVSAVYHWVHAPSATLAPLWALLKGVGAVTVAGAFERRDASGRNALHAALFRADDTPLNALMADATLDTALSAAANTPDAHFGGRTPLLELLSGRDPYRVGASASAAAPVSRASASARACALIDRMTDDALHAVDSGYSTALSQAISLAYPLVLERLVLRACTSGIDLLHPETTRLAVGSDLLRRNGYEARSMAVAVNAYDHRDAYASAANATEEERCAVRELVAVADGVVKAYRSALAGVLAELLGAALLPPVIGIVVAYTTTTPSAAAGAAPPAPVTR